MNSDNIYYGMFAILCGMIMFYISYKNLRKEKETTNFDTRYLIFGILAILGGLYLLFKVFLSI